MTTQFRSGIAALQQAIADGERRAEQARSAASGKSLNYFNWKPGDKKILRFIADDFITEYFYDFILDKTGATKNFMVDPSDPGRLSRYASPTPGIGWRRNPKTFQLEEIQPPGSKGPGSPREMSVAVAVLRHEIMRDGKLVLEDLITDREENGTMVPARFFGIVQQSVSNFWHTLAVGCVGRFGTICDRDYEITRQGEGFNTQYSIIPLPEVPELTDLEMVKKFYSYGEEWKLDDPQRFLKCPMTTAEWAAYFAGEERYQHWLTPDSPTATAAAAARPSYTPSGRDEFARDTTLNDEAQAAAIPAISPSATSTQTFATLQEQLIEAAKNK